MFYSMVLIDTERIAVSTVSRVFQNHLPERGI